ncbi:MAG: hypothetical protein ACK5U2_21435, partial [Microcystis sp.]
LVLNQVQQGNPIRKDLCELEDRDDLHTQSRPHPRPIQKNKQLRKQLVEEEIKRTIERLKDTFETAYLLLIYGSTYSSFEFKNAWFENLQLFSEYEEQDLDLALFTLFNRYLVETQKQPGYEPHIKQHSLIRNVAFNRLVSTQRKEGKPNHE